MANDKLKVALIGCGRMGQHYAEVYNTFENTDTTSAMPRRNADGWKSVSDSGGKVSGAKRVSAKGHSEPSAAPTTLPTSERPAMCPR